MLIEIIAGKHGALAETTVAEVVARLYAIGIKPDWWKLESQSAAAWGRIDAAIAAGDPLCRGVLVLGLEAPEAELGAAFRAARGSQRVKGFAVGRTIFAEPARRWFAGGTDEDAVRDMAESFGRLVGFWNTAAN